MNMRLEEMIQTLPDQVKFLAEQVERLQARVNHLENTILEKKRDPNLLLEEPRRTLSHHSTMVIPLKEKR